MRRRSASWIVTLVAVSAFVAGMLVAPAPADAACKLICCPGTSFCITCCQAPCPNPVCPP